MTEEAPARSRTVARGQWLCVGLLAASMALGFGSDDPALKILADLLVAGAALVLLVTLFLAWRESRRRRRALRR